MPHSALGSPPARCSQASASRKAASAAGPSPSASSSRPWASSVRAISISSPSSSTISRASLRRSWPRLSSPRRRATSASPRITRARRAPWTTPTARRSARPGQAAAHRRAPLIVPGGSGVGALGTADLPEEDERLDLRLPGVEPHGDPERHLTPGDRGLEPPDPFLQGRGGDEGGHREGLVSSLLGVESVGIPAIQGREVGADLGEQLRYPASQEVGRDGPLPDGEVGGDAPPPILLVRRGTRQHEGPEGPDRLECGQQPQGPFDLHSPYSLIFRASVLRWIPRSSAAAPIWPPVWVSTRSEERRVGKE